MGNGLINKGEHRTNEGYLMANGRAGQIFYSEKQDKDMQKLAEYHGRRIKTERVLVMENIRKSPIVKRIIKITLL